MNQPSRETVLKAWSHPLMAGLPTTGSQIEALSHELIHQALQSCLIPEAFLPVVRRMVHAAGDVSLAETIRFHPEAVETGCRALRDKTPVICDVRMLQAGITRSLCRVVCKIRDKNVLRLARASNRTRAAAAMHYLGDALHDAVVAVGNAPTAIWAILELAETRGIRPALVVGTPVG
ncbi:MAG: precorrin-8X methylmutase, partial [Desulfosalsimonadaceae bacterium]|nr:precorrin-8X methylmutase [Desulfosalsimonadaceae bacterium]